MIDTKAYAGSSDAERKAVLHAKCQKADGVRQVDGVKLLADMYHLKDRYSKEEMAYLFHHAVAEAIVELAEQICKEMQITQVALSGGTFLNRILLAEVMEGLQERGKAVYINGKVPCGDGGIALGQMYLATYEN